MKRIILFLIAFNFLNCVHGQWKTRLPRDHSYHNFYFGTAIGVDETVFSLARLDYTFKYDRYFVQPYIGAHVSFFSPLGFFITTSKSAYTGINFKYISVEGGVGNNYINTERFTGSFNYSFFRTGIQTKRFWLKVGPTWVHKNGTQQEPLWRVIKINNQHWTVSIMWDIPIR